MEPTSERICAAKGDSPSSMPARKAPRAGDRPTACEAQVDPTPANIASSTTNSRLAYRPPLVSTRGISQ